MAVELLPITDADTDDVAAFLAANMGSGVPLSVWRRSLDVHRERDHPNNGFMLLDGGRVVGCYLAYYSCRSMDGRDERFCNLGAWCVLPGSRFHAVRLLRAILGQAGYHFVDLSPSGNVVRMNEKLGFVHLDDRLAILPALPWLVPGGTVVADSEAVEQILTGPDLALYRDHRDAAAARHVVLRADGRSCYVVFRMDRRKKLPRVFASVLHVSEPAVFHRAHRALAAHLLVRHGALAVLVERRLVGRVPSGAVEITSPRKKMYRSTTLPPEKIDYFYSELVSVPW